MNKKQYWENKNKKKNINSNTSNLKQVSVIVERDTFESLNISKAVYAFDSIVESIDVLNQGVTFTFCFAGYELDKRNIYEIPYTELFFKKLLNECPDIFAFLNKSTLFLLSKCIDVEFIENLTIELLDKTDYIEKAFNIDINCQLFFSYKRGSQLDYNDEDIKSVNSYMKMGVKVI